MKPDQDPPNPSRCIRAGHGSYTFVVDHYEEFLHHVSPLFNSHNKYNFVWRGARDPSWPLTSSISRSLLNIRTSPDDDRRSWNAAATRATLAHLVRFIEELRGLEILNAGHSQLHEFLLSSLESPPNSFLTALQRMGPELRQVTYQIASIGQHFGLLTPFLDWTTIPAIALFFAFHEKGTVPDGEGYRAVYALNRTIVEEVCPPLEAWSEDSLNFLGTMSHDNARILGQAGLFTFVPAHLPVEEWVVSKLDRDDMRPVLIRFLIRNRARNKCLRALNGMRINARALFPDRLAAR